MEQPHQHGPNCNHGPGGHGGGHRQHGPSHGSHGQQRSGEMNAQQYFKKLQQMKKNNPQFYWTQMLSGIPLTKLLQSKGLNFFKTINLQLIMMIVAQAQNMFTFQWLPLILRPFISGLFFPLLFLIFFNFNIIFGVQDPEFTLNHLFGYLTVLFFIFTAIKQSGSLNSKQNIKKTQQSLNQRPYLQNMKCSNCKILKTFRAFHCPMCKICVPKFSRHSLAFSTCIGAGNQILAWIFFINLTILQFLTILTFFENTQYGIITNIMFYILNVYILYISFIQASTFTIINFGYGITEHQVRTWMMNQYLVRVPDRQFSNHFNKGFFKNVQQSLYSLLSLPGYQSKKKKINNNQIQQQIPISGANNTQFQILDKNKIYFVNWNKAFFYLTPQIPSYISRDKQPKMIEMFKLQKKFKQQVIKQTQGQGLSQFQIQQRAMIKMQQYMMKNNPNMMMGGPQSMRGGPPMAQNMNASHQGMPNPQQQKAMQIQMLTHMCGQLQQSQPQFAQQIKQIITKLKQDQLKTTQVGLLVRQIQQQIMKKKMQAVLKQKAQIQENNKKKQQINNENNQDQQQKLKKDQEMADEDL